MGIKSEQFNRIISLRLNRAGNDKAINAREKVSPTCIICPPKGRKPNIEINGTWTTDVDLPAFNIAIKNLYLNILTAQYTSVEVEVGYEGNTVVINGDILTMYQETPGPEGRTIIQCVYGRMQQWLDANVSLNYDAGTSLEDILSSLKNSIKADRVRTGNVAKTLTLKTPLQFDGKARAAMSKLCEIFQEDRLAVFMVGMEIRAICLTKGDFIEAPQVLQYMSAPPQENTGDEAGSFYTTITAPWMPKLSIGNILEIPSRVYIRNYATVGGSSKTQKIQVTSLSFHFGTTGGTNSMTVQGFIVR